VVGEERHQHRHRHGSQDDAEADDVLAAHVITRHRQ
jgi:hypothetical protein